MSAQPLDRRIAREAARWFVHLQGAASEQDRADCERWRARHADHERAWQLAARFHARLGEIPTELGVQALDRPQADRRETLKLLTLLIVAAPLGVAGYRGLPWRAWTADERTAVGESRELTLPDGTRVRLNTDSALDVAYDETRRLLRLRTGEIRVDSAADVAGRPLLVATAEGTLRPVGTTFTVRQLDSETRVAVLKGAVELRPLHASRPTLLPAGSQARFDDNRVESPEALQSQASDWSHGVLRAEKMRLADFAAELGRYRPGLLRCDPEVAELRISGAFQLADTDLALSALARTLPVDIRYRTRYWVTIAPREG